MIAVQVFFFFLIFDILFFYVFSIFISLLYILDEANLELTYIKNLYDFYHLKSFFLKFFISISLMSLAGLPPFGIFLLKYFVIQLLITKNYIFLSSFIVFCLIVNFYSFLRIIKLIYFFDKDVLLHLEKNNSSFLHKNIILNPDVSYIYLYVLMFFSLLIFFFWFFFDFFLIYIDFFLDYLL